MTFKAESDMQVQHVDLDDNYSSASKQRPPNGSLHEDSNNNRNSSPFNSNFKLRQTRAVIFTDRNDSNEFSIQSIDNHL